MFYLKLLAFLYMYISSNFFLFALLALQCAIVFPEVFQLPKSNIKVYSVEHTPVLGGKTFS